MEEFRDDTHDLKRLCGSDEYDEIWDAKRKENKPASSIIYSIHMIHFVNVSLHEHSICVCFFIHSELN